MREWALLSRRRIPQERVAAAVDEWTPSGWTYCGACQRLGHRPHDGCPRPVLDEQHPCGHRRRTHGCGGCDPGVVELQVLDDGTVLREGDPGWHDLRGAVEGTR